jgi:hypothetical protein
MWKIKEDYKWLALVVAWFVFIGILAFFVVG